MKKLILSLAVLATITISAQAQTQRNGTASTPDSAQKVNRKFHHHPDHKQIAENLQLTDGQKQQMKAINADAKSRMAELKNGNLSAAEYKTKKAELGKERKEKVTALLTTEQKDKLQQYQKEHQGKRKMDPAKRMDKMKEKLALSDDQVVKINAQKEVFRSKFEAIKNNQALSADDKKAQMKALMEERKNSFRSILTPDQARKMQEMKQKRAGKAA